jgi:chitin disaccharide deacetylase
MSLAEELGFEKTAKLLIIHADDGGFLQSANRATQRLLENGGITSASYMMPTPWIYQAAAQCMGRDDHDVGVHLVLNSEWPEYRWGPVAETNTVRSLLDEFGNLWPSHELFKAHAIHEMKAQIQKAIKLGFRPSHIDTHMGTVYVKPAVLRAYVQIASKFRLIPMLPRWSAALEAYFGSIPWLDAPTLRKLLLEFEQRNEVMLDRIILDAGGSSLEERTGNYLAIAESLAPGLTQLIVHLSDPAAEFDTIIDHSPRERRRYWDVEILQSGDFKKALTANGITLINWRDIQRIKYPETI